MEVLDAEQMASLIASVTEKIERELLIANRFGTLEETLKKYNLEEKTEEIVSSYYMPNAKILILGAVTSKKNDIEKTYKNIETNLNRSNVISNGTYTVCTKDNGEGFSKYNNILINRFKETADYKQGILFFIKNVRT